tara:strand:+ start:105 stop:281 length:177 start_codon:yes stop_codon:yes gene_type:complete
MKMSTENPQWEFYAESLMFQSPNPSQLPWPNFPDLIKPAKQSTEKIKEKENKKDYLNG